MKKLTEKEVIRLMREEWTRKVRTVLHENSKEKPSVDLSVEVPVAGKKEVIISPGLKVVGSGGLLYTVSEIDREAKTVTLTHEKPEGPIQQVVTWSEFNKEFERQ